MVYAVVASRTALAASIVGDTEGALAGVVFGVVVKPGGG